MGKARSTVPATTDRAHKITHITRPQLHAAIPPTSVGGARLIQTPSVAQLILLATTSPFEHAYLSCERRLGAPGYVAFI